MPGGRGVPARVVGVVDGRQLELGAHGGPSGQPAIGVVQDSDLIGNLRVGDVPVRRARAVVDHMDVDAHRRARDEGQHAVRRLTRAKLALDAGLLVVGQIARPAPHEATPLAQ